MLEVKIMGKPKALRNLDTSHIVITSHGCLHKFWGLSHTAIALGPPPLQAEVSMGAAEFLRRGEGVPQNVAR